MSAPKKPAKAKASPPVASRSRPSASPALVSIEGGKASITNNPQDARNISIERAVRGVKAALKAGHSRVVRPQFDNGTALRMGTREVYSHEEIMVRMRFRALQLADAFFEQCMRDMAKPSQLHYHMTGDNCVERWMPSSGASSAIGTMKSAAKLLLGMVEHAETAEKNHIEALRSVDK